MLNLDDFFTLISKHSALMLCLFLIVAPSGIGCSGCNDPVQPEQDLGLDMGSMDMAQDQSFMMPDTGVDLGMMPEDMMVDMPDFSRPDARDMPLDPFDFGTPDDMTIAPFAIDGVNPPSGPVSGGTQFSVQGSRLVDGTRVFFSGVEVEVESVDGALLGRTPPASSAGAVSVKVISPDGDVDALDDAFTYVDALRVDSIEPSKIPVAGGVEVTLVGRGFHDQMSVNFGAFEALQVTTVDSTVARVIAPPAATSGVVDLRLTIPTEGLLIEDAITYFEPLDLLDVTPASGLVAGGGDVLLKGAGFESGMQVYFDQTPAQVLAVNALKDEATVVVPASASAGYADIRLVTSEDVSLHQDAYLYVAEGSAPRLARVTPSTGALSGGDLVVVTGYNLDQPSLSVSFGSSDATIVDRQADRFTVETPPGAVQGSVDVVLFENMVEQDRISDGFTYLADMRLDSVSPAEGSTLGGTEVVISGAGLDNVRRVRFGGVVAEMTAITPTALTVTTPARSSGLVDVVVESQEGLVRTLSDAFRYQQALEVWGMSPSRGAVAGGTYVEVRGRGFEGQMTAQFGNNAASIVRRVDSSNLYVYSPASTTLGEVDVHIGRASDATQAQAPYPYLYFNPASRFGGASGANVDGAVNVSVLTTSGVPIPGAFVMLSTRRDTRYQGLTGELGMVTLSGPDVLGAQSVTAAAAGYSSVTVQSVDAENITILLNTTSPPSGGGGAGDPPPFGIIKGTLVTPGKLADPTDETQYDMAIVGTTSVSAYGGNPNAGPGAVVLGGGEYEIISRIGDLSVVAMCGVFDENTQTFDPQYLAVERYMSVSDKGEYDVDLVCDIPLDQTLNVKLINPSYAPTGPTSNRASVVWNFGFEGYFRPPVVADSLQSVLPLTRQPTLTGLLQDITLDVTAGSYTQGFSPSSQTFVGDLSMTQGVLTMPPLLDVPEPVSPMPQGVVENSRISWESSGPYFPDMYVLVLRNESGQTVWTMTVPGMEQSVVLPDFPDFSGIPVADRPDPFAEGPLFLTITAVRIPGFDYNQFTYQDFSSSRWEAVAVNRWSMSFPE